MRRRSRAPHGARRMRQSVPLTLTGRRPAASAGPSRARERASSGGVVPRGASVPSSWKLRSAPCVKRPSNENGPALSVTRGGIRPSPAAASVIAGFAILFYALRRDDNPLPYAAEIDLAVQWAAPFVALLAAALMVSRVPYPHVVNQFFRGNRSFGHVVGVVFALAVIMIIRGYAVPLACLAFLFLGPIRYIWQEYFQRHPHDEPLF